MTAEGNMKTIWLAWAFLIGTLAGCGGGGSGGGDTTSAIAPYIWADVISFPDNAVPPGFASPGFNGLAYVDVISTETGLPIPGATVTINGVDLAYDRAEQDYAGEVVIDPGKDVTLRVTVGGSTYSTTTTQLTSYPTITAPASSASWYSIADNLIAWSGVAPTPDSVYAVALMDIDGNIVWPSVGGFRTLPSSASSTIVNSNSLATGERYVTVGLLTFVEFSGAAPASIVAMSGFNYIPVTVETRPPATLVSIAVSPDAPTIAASKARQLTATGTYSDGTKRDLTAQVTWSSADLTIAKFGSNGSIEGVNAGTTTISAVSGTISGGATVKVFAPNPSPAPPLSHSVTYQIDYAHSGRAVFGTPLTFPSTPTWSITLDGYISYPVIAEGKVFVTTSYPGSTTYGTTLYALDKETGDIAWGPVPLSGTYFWSGHAYDHGKLFVVNYDGLLLSFDAATGNPGWSTKLPNQYAFSAPPTAVNGIVYVGGAGTGGTVYAVDQSNGEVLWTAGVANGDKSSPTVSDDGVFVSYPCQVYKLDPLTGVSIWHYSGGCSGGGGKTTAYANGLVYVRDPGRAPQVFDAASGTLEGTFSSALIPALSTQFGYFLNAGTLQGIDLTSDNVVWSFAGDGRLVSAPIMIDDHVIVGSSSGNVYALDGATGVQTWTSYAGAAISAPDEQNVSRPLTGFGAGEGYLIVPAGSVLSAWQLAAP